MLGTNQFTTTISRLDQIYIKKKEKEQILTPALRPGRRPEIYVDSYAGDALFLPTLKNKQTYYPPPKTWEKECAGSLVFL